jgi:hypothetical protein
MPFNCFRKSPIHQPDSVFLCVLLMFHWWSTVHCYYVQCSCDWCLLQIVSWSTVSCRLLYYIHLCSFICSFNSIVWTGGVRYHISILVMWNKRYSSKKLNQNGSEFHPASYSMGTGFLSPNLRRSGRKIDHSPSSNFEVKNEWNYTFTSSCTFRPCKREALHLLAPH